MLSHTSMPSTTALSRSMPGELGRILQPGKTLRAMQCSFKVLTAVMAYLLSNIVPISQTAQLSFHRGFTSDCDLDDDLELRDTLSAGPEMATVGEVCGNDAKADAHVAGEPVVAEHVASESEKRVSASVNSDTGGSKKKLRLV